MMHKTNVACTIMLNRAECRDLVDALGIAINNIQADMDRAAKTEADAVTNASFINAWLQHRSALHELLIAVKDV